MNFIVPREYMIIASGKQIHKENDQTGKSLFKYEITNGEKAQ
jgi:hypothetical protein